jgi:hypothetical protein
MRCRRSWVFIGHKKRDRPVKDRSPIKWVACSRAAEDNAGQNLWQASHPNGDYCFFLAAFAASEFLHFPCEAPA